MGQLAKLKEPIREIPPVGFLDSGFERCLGESKLSDRLARIRIKELHGNEDLVRIDRQIESADFS